MEGYDKYYIGPMGHGYVIYIRHAVLAMVLTNFTRMGETYTCLEMRRGRL